MMKKLFVIFCLVIFAACQGDARRPDQIIDQGGKHQLDLGHVTLLVPKKWSFEQEKGVDSFVGGIKAEGVLLNFDCSSMGYANSLVQSEQDYLEQKWWYNGEFGVAKEGTEISTRRLTKAEDRRYAKADYIGEIKKSSGEIKLIPIELPVEITAHNFRLDSDAHYVYKTIWPKTPGKGMTGIYIHSRKSSFDFQMNGIDLSAQNQQLALQAFKTIKFKK